MDHLPCPESATDRNKIIVPYVCHEKYDGGDFMTYPSRRKDSVPALRAAGLFPGRLSPSHQRQLASLSKQDLESFYQNWLHFGLIHEILGSLYAPEDFIYACQDDSGYTKAVSTLNLVPAVDDWVIRVQEGRVDLSIITYAHVAQCLCLAHAALEAVRSNIDPNIRLSLVSLGQTFTYAANKAFDITDPVRDNKCPFTWSFLIDDDYWKGRLLPNGWCVSEVKLLLDATLSLQTLNFLACIDKTDAEQSHQGCDTQQCMVYQNDLGKYQTQHVSKECDCEELSVDPEVLYKILRTKALPLIRVRPSQTLREISIDIVASRPTSRYVALSHVWADGLGNPYANALPRCQLSLLGNLIRQLDMPSRSRDAQDLLVKEEEDGEEKEDELFLWCDTLCCPIQPKESKDMALECMYRTYQDATHVLVLEASLRRYDVESLGIDEVSMRILTSPWMRRLWTLQEGALPALTNRLWFQLSHRALNLRELRINARDKWFSSISRKGLAGDMLKRLGSFANIFLEGDSTHPGADLTRLIAALHDRSVSIPSDEPLLIGNLLGLDSAQILNGGDGAVASRMNRLWRMIPSAVHGIASNLLFRVGPRLADPGLRWAPATLLGENRDNILIKSSENENEKGILTASDGLLVRFHGFHLSLASRAKGLPSHRHSILQLNRPNSLWMRDSAGSWYLMRRTFPVEQDQFLTDKTLAEIVHEGKNMWVVYPDSRFPRQPDNKAQASVGLIVEAEAETEVKAEEDKDETSMKKTCARLHVSMACVPTSNHAWLMAATTVSAQFASESLALPKLAALENGVDEYSSSSALEATALEELASEIHQMATKEEAKEATVAAGNEFDISVMEELITMVVWGQYVCLGETLPRTQRWCVD